MDILFGGYWLEILVDDYVLNFDNGSAAFCIYDSNDDTMAILGDVFMRNFYIIHDVGNMQMGFVPLAFNPITKADPVAGTIPLKSYTTYTF